MPDMNLVQKSREIAALLINVVQLPNNQSFTSIFGKGDEASDLEAMTNWVNSNMHEIDAEEAIQRLSRITSLKQATNKAHGDDYASI